SLTSIRQYLEAWSGADLVKTVGPKFDHVETTCEQSFGHPLDSGVENRVVAHEHERAASGGDDRWASRAWTAHIKQTLEHLVEFAHKGLVAEPLAHDDFVERSVRYLSDAALIACEVEQLAQIGQIALQRQEMPIGLKNSCIPPLV